MAHRKKERKFGRTRSARKELIRSLARSVILHGRIQTTEARAKGVRPFLEKVITKSRNSDLATRRLLLSRFKNDDEVVKKLLEVFGPRYKNRDGGYTRIIRVENRLGSGRNVAIIEFV